MLMTSKSAKKESTKKDKEDFSGERQKLKDGFGVQSKSKNNSDTHPLVCNELLAKTVKKL
jgi:hypothetical protein